MKLSFRWYGESDPISLEYISQIPGMRSIVSAVYDVKPGEVWPEESLAKMKKLMADLREKPLTEIAGVKVVLRKDYADGTETNVETGAVTEMELKGSNVLKYKLADGTDLVVRPSGTEPKVKVYILASGATKAEADENVAKYTAWAEGLKN